MIDSYGLIRQMEDKIATLPRGYISKKTLNGKTRHYRQWKEAGKVKSVYIRDEELEQVTAQIEERKALEKRVRELKKQFPTPKYGKGKFFTKIQTGGELERLANSVRGLEKRDIFPKLQQYLSSSIYTRVCILYGLRRTGKTTMLLQAIAEMSPENFAKTAYVKLRTTDTMDQIIRDLDTLLQDGYQYVFIDEVTLMEEFIDSAALFSDLYTMQGMKIVLSGTDSLGFWFARDNELYDRERTYHTTFIPYREYSRILGIDSVDEYIRYGGTLRLGETNFDDEELKDEGVAFRDDESTRRYIDTAISKNIQHSLAFFEYGHYFGHLRELYEAGELTSAINRVIEDMNHDFVVSVLTRDFVSHDLGITARNLRMERDPKKRTNILDTVDVPTVTEKLMQILDIRNQKDQTIKITSSQAVQIKMYLKALDLIVECPLRNSEAGLENEVRVLFTQPGMRYCQAQALVYSLMRDETFAQVEADKKSFITERILEEVRGRMLEDIVLLETQKALGKRYDVFKYRFASGEYDMVIYDRERNCCAAYEIKHSKECVREQARHLMDERKLSLTSPRFGDLAGRYVLYLGENRDTEDGIAYRNAEQFLKSLPDITLDSGLEETEAEDEAQGFHPTM